MSRFLKVQNDIGVGAPVQTLPLQWPPRRSQGHCMNRRENTLRAWTFRRPQRIPTTFSINASCAHHYPLNDLQRLIERHASLFPQLAGGWRVHDLKPAPWARAGRPFTDDWGCTWETSDDGITGVVTRHRLADWSDFESFQPPDPARCSGMGPVDWVQIASHWQKLRDRDELRNAGGLPHGFFFLRLTDLRGYQDALLDMADDDPRMLKLIGMVEQFSAAIVSRFMALDPDVYTFAEDLGAQDTPLISPLLFRRHIKPSYARLMRPARDRNLPVFLHCDGYIMDLVDDLLGAGVTVLNPQDLVNGIDNLARHVKGRAAIQLDIDRQAVTPCGTPGDIDDLIHESVEKLGSAEGGLSLIFGLYPGTPLENAEAVMTAMEKYATYWA
jgi:hypothetical protein